MTMISMLKQVTMMLILIVAIMIVIPFNTTWHDKNEPLKENYLTYSIHPILAQPGFLPG